jgi:hypothetical protein
MSDSSTSANAPRLFPADLQAMRARMLAAQQERLEDQPRFVFVQPSAYGLDNSCMYDEMATMDPSVRRAICHLDEKNAKDSELSRWNALASGGRVSVRIEKNNT